MKKVIVMFLVGSILQIGTAQVGIGTVSPNPSAALDINSTEQGLLVPRVNLSDVTDTMLDGTNNAATGLLIYNTNSGTTGGSGVGFYYFNGTIWVAFGGGSTDDDWFEQGTTTPPNAITDNIFTNGSVGINTFATSSRQLNVEASNTASEAGHFSNISTGSGTKYGIRTTVSSNTNAAKYGMYNSLGSIDNTGTLYGTYNYLYDGTNDIPLYGIYNSLTGSGNANKTGLHNNISINSSGVITGVHNELVNEATGNIYGMNNVMTNNQLTAQSFGFRNIMSGNSGNKSGIYSRIQNAGNGNNYGMTSILEGPGTGTQYVLNHQISNTGGNVHKGIEQNFIGDASSVYGTVNRLRGTATIAMTGIYNWFTALTGDHVGFRNYFDDGNNAQTGLFNDFASQNGSQTGTNSEFRSISTGTQIGNRVEFLATSSGIANKYGFYVVADGGAAGTINGIYASIPQATGFAAHLDGNVIVNDSGSARDVRIESDTKPYVFFSDGTNNVVRFGNQSGALSGDGATINGVVLDYAADFDIGSNGTVIGIGGAEYIADAGNFQLAFNGAVIPAYDNLDDLGSSTQRWDDVYATSGVVNTSDIRLKKNIQNLKYGLKEIMNIKPISYQWKDSSRTSKIKLGFSAQQLLEVLPEVVKTEDIIFEEDTRNGSLKQNENLGVYYSDIIPVLTKAIQEQQQLIKTLEKRIEILEKNR